MEETESASEVSSDCDKDGEENAALSYITRIEKVPN